MKFLFFLPTKRLAKEIALFTIGIIIGAALTNLAIGYQTKIYIVRTPILKFN